MKKYTFYRIICKDPNIKDCFVGVTVDLDKAIMKHSKRIKKNNPSCLYKLIRDNGGISNWCIHIIIEYETISKDEDITPILKHYILCYNANFY